MVALWHRHHTSDNTKLRASFVRVVPSRDHGADLLASQGLGPEAQGRYCTDLSTSVFAEKVWRPWYGTKGIGTLFGRIQASGVPLASEVHQHV